MEDRHGTVVLQILYFQDKVSKTKEKQINILFQNIKKNSDKIYRFVLTEHIINTHETIT